MRLTVLRRHETLQEGVEPVPRDAWSGEARARHLRGRARGSSSVQRG